jgi:hypothetical protein
MARAAERLMAAALLAVVLAVFSHTRADPDLWGHVRFGGDTVAARAVARTDPYSFASDRPWINHEWLAEVLMYGAYAAGGGPGLVALKVATLAGMFGIVAWSWPRALGGRGRRLMAGIAVIGTIPQANHVRPQLFSLLLFAVVLLLLVRPPAAVRSPWRRGAALSITFALWANLHGGWIVGGLVAGIWGAFSLWQERTRRAAVIWAATLGAAFLATALNPYGWRLWQFLRETVGFGRDQITDWQPIYRMPPAFLALWILVAVAGAAAIARGWRARRFDPRAVAVSPRAVAVTAVLAFASFRVNRLLAFFTLAVVMLLADAAAAERDQPGLAAAPAAVPPVAPGPRRAASAPAVAAAALVGLVTLAGALAFAFENASCVRMDPALVPEREAFAALSSPVVQGRLLTWFDWGEYAIWHLAPRVKVSLDGRRETVYSDAALRTQFDFYRDPSLRDQVIAELQPDFIWLPASLPVTRRLEQDGWVPIFSGQASTLLSRRPGVSVPASVRFDQGRRCFPGP